MKVTLCGSIEFSNEFLEIANILKKAGYEVNIPLYTQKIRDGEVTLEEFTAKKALHGDTDYRKKAGVDLIKRHHRLIQESDAILVVNLEKKNIPGYIGGNTFLEMGFAHVLDKKIYLLHPIPEMPYKDELTAMQPEIIDGDIAKINKPLSN